MLKSDVCAIIINYNGTQDTIECVESLLQSGYKNLNIVIVDNGSDVSIEKNDNPVLCNECVDIIKTNENRGFAYGNNFGIKYAIKKFNPSFFLIINNDTTVSQGFLSELVKYSDEKTGIVTCKISNYYDKNIIWYAGGSLNNGLPSMEGCNQPDKGQYNYVRNVDFASGCLWLVPSIIIEKVGLMNEQFFLYYEDTEYCKRITDRGYRIVYNGNAQIFHKIHASTVRISGVENYYMTRNQLFYIKLNENHLIKAYIRCLYHNIKIVLKGERKLYWVVIGYIDFIRNKSGKRNF